MRVAAKVCGAVWALSFTCWAAGIAVSQTAAADEKAAHELADRFSRAEDAESTKAAAAKKAKLERERAAAAAADEAKQRAADEADMLARAQAEAAARRAADERNAAELDRLDAERETARGQADQLTREAEEQRQAEQAKAEEVRKAEAERLARDVEQQRLADAKLKAEEVQRAEAERIAHEAEEKRIAEERRLAAEQRQVKEAEEQRQAEEKRQAEEQRRAEARAAEARAAEAQTALEARRQEDAQRVADKFRSAREAREARDHAQDDQSTRNSLGGPPPPEAKVPWESNYDSAPEPTARSVLPPPLPARVTVLLSLEQTYTKFAGAPRTPHPVLCVGNGCYISTGADAPADYMPRLQALGPANTLGRRAGVCRAQRMCVFRGVALPPEAPWIQPVNMGFWHHDRLDIRNAAPDQTCEVIGRQLYCAKPIAAHGYRAWIVPEETARLAGRAALENALANGLPLARSAGGETWSAQALPTR